MKKIIQLGLLGLATLTLAACSSTGEATNMAGSSLTEADMRFDIVNSQGQNAGTGIVQEAEEGVSIHVTLEGLPAGEYSMAIHEAGSATAPDFQDAGEPVEELTTITVSENGEASTTVDVQGMSMSPAGENSLQDEDGSSLIIQEQAGEESGQSSGNTSGSTFGGVMF